MYHIQPVIFDVNGCELFWTLFDDANHWHPVSVVEWIVFCTRWIARSVQILFIAYVLYNLLDLVLFYEIIINILNLFNLCSFEPDSTYQVIISVLYWPNYNNGSLITVQLS